MLLRGMEFGSVHYAAGTGGFEDPKREYWYHRYQNFRLISPDFTGATPVRKTVTLEERNTTNGANMDLYPDTLGPVEKIPRCIAINPLWPCAVNAVGLTNFGLETHLDRGVWQEYAGPQFISLMAVGTTHAERMDQWRQMFSILEKRKHEFRGPVALQENHSCPNTGDDPRELMLQDSEKVLTMGNQLGFPQVPKFNVMQLTVEHALRIGNHPACDALLYSNTIPWNDLPLRVRLLSFGTPFSPLVWRGITAPGGYSGPYIFPFVEMMTRDLRAHRFTKPIIACGGITTPSDVRRIHAAGADAIELATVAMPGGRPWRVQPMIKLSHELWRC